MYQITANDDAFRAKSARKTANGWRIQQILVEIPGSNTKRLLLAHESDIIINREVLSIITSILICAEIEVT